MKDVFHSQFSTEPIDFRDFLLPAICPPDLPFKEAEIDTTSFLKVLGTKHGHLSPLLENDQASSENSCTFVLNDGVKILIRRKLNEGCFWRTGARQSEPNYELPLE